MAIVKVVGNVPQRAHISDAGADLQSSESLNLLPGMTKIVKTGTWAEIESGFCGLVLPRSGLASKGITIQNAPGLIDAGYRGEIGVILHNTNRLTSFAIEVGDRIAQLMIVPTWYTLYEPVSQLSDSERGPDGFGSTG